MTVFTILIHLVRLSGLAMLMFYYPKFAGACMLAAFAIFLARLRQGPALELVLYAIAMWGFQWSPWITPEVRIWMWCLPLLGALYYWVQWRHRERQRGGYY